MLALVGYVVLMPASGMSRAKAASERKPAAPVASTPDLVSPSGDGATSAALLAPAGHVPAGLIAPSYAGWLAKPPQGKPAGGGFVATGRIAADPEVFQRVSAAPATAAPVAPVPALIRSPVPLPPKRLAERKVPMQSEGPLPPSRVAPPPPPIPQVAMATQVSPFAPVEAPNDLVDQAANAPDEDAAGPIDDAPELVRPTADRAPAHIEALIQRHAERFDVPARLVRRVAWRESKFDPTRRNGPYWGLMQIRVDTARGLGFRGAPKDLLDADTNMSFAVAYLANAYRVAGRNETRAVMLYAKGYYYEAKRKGMLGSLIRTAASEE